MLNNNMENVSSQNVVVPDIKVKNKRKKTLSKYIFASFFVVLAFGGGFLLGRDNKPSEAQLAYNELKIASSSDDVFDFNLYWETWAQLRNNFVNKNKVKNKEMFYGSLKGMVAASNDPYTIFMTPDETKEFASDLAGTFEGIGAEVGMRDDTITIIAPLAGMPAEKAGLKAGDKVYAIDGESALGLSVDAAVKKIRGPKGTTVTLTIIRDKENKPREIKIERGLIFVKSVTVTSRPDGIAVIKVGSFNDDTLELFNKAVEEITLKKPKGIILDLRNNPGGYLDTAVAMASEWIQYGPVVIEQFGDGHRNEYPATGNPRLDGIPTMVLVNGGSASASEIVAGALRDFKKATIIGEKTYGKGSVQTLRDLSDGSSIKITVASWLTPEGDYINEKGINPQVEVKFSPEDIEKNRDPQLQKALDLILKPLVPKK